MPMYTDTFADRDTGLYRGILLRMSLPTMFERPERELLQKRIRYDVKTPYKTILNYICRNKVLYLISDNHKVPRKKGE